MLRRNLRIALGIAVMVILSVLVLSFRDIDLPGDSLDRSGNGPLGLVMGLDLKGGTHLVYEAQSPVTVDVTFANPLPEEDLKAALGNMGFTTSNINAFSKESFSLDVPGLSSEQVEAFVQDLEDELGAVAVFSHEREERTRLEIRIEDAPNEDSVTEVVQGLGYSEATVTTLGSQAFAVDGLPSLGELGQDAETALEDALGELFPLDALLPLSQLPAFQDEEGIAIAFEPLPNERDIQGALNSLGHRGALVLNLDGKSFTVTLEALDDEARDLVLEGLRDEVAGVTEVSTSLIETALIDVTFQVGVDPVALEEAFTDLGFLEAIITEARGRDYAVNLPSVSEERELTFRDDLGQRLGVVETFRLNREEPTDERMDGVMDTIERRVNAFGITEPIVQRLGDDRVIVQLPGAEDTIISLTFREQVTEQTLVNALKELGLSRASVDSLEGELLPNSVNISIPDLTEESREQIRAALENQFGPLEGFSGDFELIRITFQQPIDLAVVQSLESILDDLGFVDADVAPVLGDTFRIRAFALTTGDEDELRRDLAAAVSPIESFEVSGGVKEAKALIGQTARLEFKERTCLDINCTQFTDRDAVGDRGEPLTGDNLTRAFAGTHPTTPLPIVNFVFDGTGTRIFRDLTFRIAGDSTKCIAHVLDEEFIICPFVQRAIVSGSGFIEGPDFTFDRVSTLAIQLESGSLPLSLEVVRESTVDSLLGNESLRASLKAGLAGLALIVFFMVAYYRMAGLVAAMALVVYALIILAVFKMVPVTLTLSGLAGVILSIGMAIDANILIFERLKEELRTGRSLLSATEIGFRRAWPAIRDSNVSTFITCAILFFFGRELGEPRITGFAITLAIGVALSMFTALFVSRNLIQLLVFTPVGRRLNLFSPEGVQRPIGVAGGER